MKISRRPEFQYGVALWHAYYDVSSPHVTTRWFSAGEDALAYATEDNVPFTDWTEPDALFWSMMAQEIGAEVAP